MSVSLYSLFVKDYYTVLNVNPDATPAQIDAAYRRLMQRHHPNARSSVQALERMRELNQAWRVLSDASQRAAYDRSLASNTAYEPPAAAPTLRSVPQANLAHFGARHTNGNPCLVVSVVALVVIFAFGILGWGLDQQMNFGAMLGRAFNEMNALLPTRPSSATAVAEDAPTPTSDPRCHDGCETPPPGCVVKGDVEADGVRFFYLPNDEGYARVTVDVENGDRWFCALTLAQAAGWTRKAPTETPLPTLAPEALTTRVTRRAFIVCAENVTLYQGPGETFAALQTVPNGTRLWVTGVNGEWSVVTAGNQAQYIRTTQLCAPTRASTAAPTVPALDAPTPTPVSVVTASAAGLEFKYSAPQIIKPTDGETYKCNRDLILQWSLDTSIAADEFFLVESKPVEHERWNALAEWTKETTIVLHPSRGNGPCDTPWWSNTGVYEWRVSVVRGSKQTPTYASPFSQSFRINYGQ